VAFKAEIDVGKNMLAAMIVVALKSFRIGSFFFASCTLTVDALFMISLLLYCILFLPFFFFFGYRVDWFVGLQNDGSSIEISSTKFFGSSFDFGSSEAGSLWFVWTHKS
jgi:hypothetical protein